MQCPFGQVGLGYAGNLAEQVREMGQQGAFSHCSAAVLSLRSCPVSDELLPRSIK